MKLALAKQPESYSELLSRSLRLFRFSFRSTYLFALLVSVIIFIPRLICVAVGQNVFLVGKHWGHQQLLFALIYISTLWFVATILWAIHCTQQGKHEKYIAEIKTAGKRLLYVLGAAIIISIIGVLSSTIAWPLHYLFMSLHLYEVHPYVTAVLLLIVCLIGAGIPICIATLFYLYFPLIVIENDGIFLALKQSTLLVWGHIKRTLGLALTPWLIYLITIILIKMIFKINLHVYFMPFDQTSDFPTTALHILILSLFIPWSCSVMLVQLQDLELRKKAVKLKK